MSKKIFRYKADLDRVIDGDTVVLKIVLHELFVDLGFGITLDLSIRYKRTIRLKGVNAPERGSEEADKATEFVEEALSGKTLLLETVKDRTGKFGRILGRIYYDGIDNEIVNELLRNGLGKPYDGGKRG